MKRLLFSVAAATLFLTACNKDDDNNTTQQDPKSQLIINNGDTTETPFGFRVQWSTEEGGRMVMSDINLNEVPSGSKASAITFQVDTFVNGQTYVYMSKDSAAFNKRVNFSAAEVGLDANISKGVFAPGTGTQLSRIKSGSVTIAKDKGEVYRISYILDYGDQKVSGGFTGLMPKVDN